MRLPSLETLMQQADRLVRYMGDKHRFRLKTGSALEAMAALHQLPDWNTLHALAKRADEAAAPRDSRASSGETRYPLTWDGHGYADVEVSASDWYRHTLATGTWDSRRRWLLQHLAVQLERGCPGVFVNVLGDSLPEGLHDELTSRTVVIDLRKPAGLCLNLMNGPCAEETAALLLAVCLPPADNPGADYYKALSNRVLTSLIEVLRQQERATLTNLVSLLQGGPAAWADLYLELPPDTPGSAHLQLLMASPDVRASSVTAALAGRLHLLMTSTWGQKLFAANPQAPHLADLIEAGSLVIIEQTDYTVADSAIRQQAALVSHALRYMAMRRLGGSADRLPAVIGIGDVERHCLDNFLVRLTEQSRAARIALLLTVRSERILKQSFAGECLLANTWHHVHFQAPGNMPPPPEDVSGLGADLANAQVIVRTPGFVRYR